VKLLSRMLMVAGLGLASLVGLVGADEPAKKVVDPSQAEDVQDVVIFLPGRPVTIRTHLVDADGKPFLAKWQAHLRKFFDMLDRDGDGILDKDEAARLPAAAVMVQQMQGNPYLQIQADQGGGRRGPQVGMANFDDLDQDKDGKVSFGEFLAYYRGNGAGPVAMNAGYGASTRPT